jgi:hypothetical protein
LFQMNAGIAREQLY